MPRHSKVEAPRSFSPWAKRMRELRIDRDLTQETVAEFLHVSQRVYADYELGNVRVPIEHLIRLSFYYNVCIDYICTAINEPRPFPEITVNSQLYSLLKK